MPCSAKLLVLAALLPACLAYLPDGREMPTDYSTFWEGRDSMGLTCFQSLPALQLEKAYAMDGVAGSSAGRNAGSEFAASLRHARESGQALEAAKANSTLDGVPLYTEEGARMIAVSYLQAGAAGSLDTFWKWERAERSACDGLRHSQRAIMLASLAANEARGAALERLDELRLMGAGCASYSGPEKATYNYADGLAQMRLDGGGLGAQVEWHYENLSQRYAAALAEAYDVHWAFENGSARFGDSDAFAKALGNMCGGGENLVTGWIAVHRQLGDAIEGMDSRCNASLAAYRLGAREMDAEYDGMADEGYSRIDSSLLSRLAAASPSDLHPVEDAEPPSEKMMAVRSMMDEASALAAQAEVTRSTGQECHVADSISLLTDAQLRLSDADRSMGELREDARGMEGRAREACTSRVSELESRIGAYGTNSSAAARLKAEAQDELAHARQQMESADSLDIGRKLEAYADVLDMAASIGLLLSDDNRSTAERQELANSSLRHFCGLAERAEADGLDVEMEKEFCSAAGERLAVGTAEDFFAITLQAKRLEDVLYAKARVRYGYLDDEFASLREIAAAILPYSPAAAGGLEPILREYWNGAGIEPSKALGNYKRIEAQARSIEAELEIAKTQVAKEVLEKSIRVEVIPVGEAAAGADFIEGIYILVHNPLPFGTSTQISLSVPLPEEVRPCRISQKSGNAIAGAGTETVEILLQPIAAGADSHIMLLADCGVVAFADGGMQTRVVSLSPDALEAETSLTLSVTRSLERLRVSIRIAGMPSEIYAEAAGAFPETAMTVGNGKAEVVLSNVREGNVSVLLHYRLQNPYSIETSGYRSESSANGTLRISFIATVRSNGLDLKDVPVRIPVSNASLRARDISIAPLGNARIGNFSATEASGGTTVCWVASSVPAGGSEAFTLSYEAGTAESGPLLPPALPPTGQPDPAQGQENALREALAKELASLPETGSEALLNARRSFANGDYDAAAGYIAAVREEIKAEEDARREKTALLTAELDGQVLEFSALRGELRVSLDLFVRATTLTVGRAPLDSETKRLENTTLEHEVSAVESEMEALSGLFSEFSSGKEAFVLGHGAEAEAAGERLDALNKTVALADSATKGYENAAGASCDEARLRLEQVKKLAPASEQYGEVLANLTATVDEADSAFSAKRYSDAIVLSERANAGLAKVVSGISEIEQQEPAGGTPVYLFALPLLGFAILGYLYFRKKPEKKEPRKIMRLE